MVNKVETVSHIFRKQSLHATIARACRNCGAPGFWHDVPGVNVACYDPEKKKQAEMRDEGFAPVGSICPACGCNREEVESLGEIWSKVWRGPTVVEMIREKLRQFKIVGWRFK